MKGLKITETNVRALHETGHFLAFLIIAYKTSLDKSDYLTMIRNCKKISIQRTNDLGGFVDIDEIVFVNKLLKYYTFIYGCTSVYDYFNKCSKELEFSEFENFILKTGGGADLKALKKELTIQEIYDYYKRTRKWLSNKYINRFYVKLGKKLKRKINIHSEEILQEADRFYDILNKNKREI